MVELEESGDEPAIHVLNCSTCGRRWLTVHEDGERLPPDPNCRHLRFVLYPHRDTLDFYNGFSYEELLNNIGPASRELTPKLDGLPLAEFIRREYWNRDPWMNVYFGIDSLVQLREEGATSAPGTQITYFGAELDNKLTPADFHALLDELSKEEEEEQVEEGFHEVVDIQELINLLIEREEDESRE